MRTRNHVVDVYVPVGPGSGGNTVGAIFAVFGLVVGFALLVMGVVVLAFPSTDRSSVQYTPVPVTHTVCAAFCTTSAPAGGAQR
ncbi:hypothetical protein [Nocardia salmonicida]|uniref:hypothetical protein n=1 Tax=Nocardia salmonicida TaxID=53431 RepID=UPI003796B9BC